MAIFKGIISKMSGFVGNLAFRRVADQTIVSDTTLVINTEEA